MSSKKPFQNNNKLLLKYAGLATQLLVGLAIALFAGIKLDAWLKLNTPLLVWILPLMVIVAMMYQVIKDTTKNK